MLTKLKQSAWALVATAALSTAAFGVLPSTVLPSTAEAQEMPSMEAAQGDNEPLTPHSMVEPASEPATHSTLIVNPGDSLWSIVQEQLNPGSPPQQIASAVPGLAPKLVNSPVALRDLPPVELMSLASASVEASAQVDPEEYRLLWVGVLALTLVLVILMVQKLPMKRPVRGGLASRIAHGGAYYDYFVLPGGPDAPEGASVPSSPGSHEAPRSPKVAEGARIPPRAYLRKRMTPERCDHDAPLMADRIDGGWVITCLLCETTGPIRETAEESRRALMDPGGHQGGVRGEGELQDEES